MAAAFDPYRKWLGIPEGARPPTHYELLGIATDERDAEVIHAAVLRHSAYVRNFQRGEHGEHATRILNELAAAEACLTDARLRAAYDAQLPRPAPVATPNVAPRASVAPLSPLRLSAPFNFDWGATAAAPNPRSETWSALSAPAWMRPSAAQRRRQGLPLWAWALAAVGCSLVMLLLVATVLVYRSRGTSLADDRAPYLDALPIARGAPLPTPMPETETSPAEFSSEIPPAEASAALPVTDVPTPLAVDAHLAQVRRIESKYSVSLAFSPDGRRLVLGRYDSAIALVDVASGMRQELVGTDSLGCAGPFAFSPSGNVLLAANPYFVRVWRADPPGFFRATSIALRISKAALCHAVSADDAFALCGHDAQLCYWNLRTGQEVHRWNDLSFTVKDCLFLPGGTSALATDGWQVYRFDLRTGIATKVLNPSRPGVEAALSSDGRYLALRSLKSLEVYDLQSGINIATMNASKASATTERDLVFSPDGDLLYFWGANEQVLAWHVPTQETALAIDTALRGRGIVISPNGRMLAYPRDDCVVVVELPSP